MDKHDVSKGIQQYWEFHQLEPKRVGSFGKGMHKLPSKVLYVGDASYTNYRSKKWTGKMEYYTHDHEAGVHVHLASAAGDTALPKFISTAKTLVYMGDCIGLGYIDDQGDLLEATISQPFPGLFCTPDGKSLLVVESHSKLLAIIWGGYLDVTARGIVG